MEDNVTGLVWQGCVRGQSGDDCSQGEVLSVVTWEEALAYCDELSWGGHRDWRLPDKYELQSTVDYISYPVIDEEAFPETPTYQIWSSSTHILDESPAGNAWVLDSTGGLFNKNKYQTDTDDYYFDHISVRCVHDGPLQEQQIEPSLEAGDRVVTDSLTGLMWQGCPRGLSGESCGAGSATTSDWQEALAYCQDLSWAGHDDWRLPNVKELASITDSRQESPSIDPSTFPGTPTDDFWTSSPADLYYESNAFLVNYGFGMVAWYDKSGELFARCVRGGT
ncbi:MAG: DUF1566 domain-containing protein [Polyangia bacterium]